MTASPRILRQPGAHPYTYGPDHPSIATVSPGESVTLVCVDAFENKIHDESQSYADVIEFPFTNPQTGPVTIEGAEPGDTLKVHLEHMEITRDYAISGLVPNFGLLSTTDKTRLLHEPLPELVRKLPIRDGHIWFGERSRPLSPFMGTLGTSPRLESISSLVPSYYGGNMDCPEVCPGNTISLPVLVDGALFFCGDGHALQGHGEIGGVACEVPVNLTCRFELVKNSSIAWPRIENEESLMVVGSARPLEDAARIACTELVTWAAERMGLSEPDTLVWLTQIVELRVGNVCDPNYSVVAAVRKEYLDPRNG